MTPEGGVWIDVAGRFALIVLLASMVLAFIRLVKGPDAADRVVALDIISVLVVAFIAAFCIHAGETAYLDVAIAFALIAFLGTVAFTRFLMRSAKTAHRRRQAPGDGHE